MLIKVEELPSWALDQIEEFIPEFLDMQILLVYWAVPNHESEGYIIDSPRLRKAFQLHEAVSQPIPIWYDDSFRRNHSYEVK